MSGNYGSEYEWNENGNKWRKSGIGNKRQVWKKCNVERCANKRTEQEK